jgi:hypothetical protein
MQRSYSFWVMADLGISQSYFACQKYPESELVRITQVVVFITTNPTKLVLHFSEFSTISYAFYKFQPKGYTIGDILLRGGPWKDSALCNVAPGHGGRRHRPKFWCSGAGIGRGKGGGWLGAHHASVWGFGRGGGAAGDGVERRQSAEMTLWCLEGGE